MMRCSIGALAFVLCCLGLVAPAAGGNDVPCAAERHLLIEDLNRLVELHHEGALSDDEFARAKAASIATAESLARDGHAGAHDALNHHHSTDIDHAPVAPKPHLHPDAGGGGSDVGGVGATGTGQAPKDLSKMYGFYLHVYADPAAVIWQVEQLKKYFPGSPIYIMSDGGMGFDGLCKERGCTFKRCPPANDRWNPWPFLRRFWDAVMHMKTEYVVMLEPDNWIHREIRVHPKHDAGGLFDANPPFSNELIHWAEKQGQRRKPGFKWKYPRSGLAGGSYFRSAAVLDAFSDAAVSELAWREAESLGSKRVYSSDFAMPVLLAARGYTYEPWAEVMQKDTADVVPQPETAAFEHYGRGVEGGKPTYNMKITPDQEGLYEAFIEAHKRANSNCQRCYVQSKYVGLWGSEDCTNVLAEGDLTGIAPTPDQIKLAKQANKLPAEIAGNKFKCADGARDASLCGSWIIKEHCDFDINKYTAAIAVSTCPKFCGKCDA